MSTSDARALKPGDKVRLKADGTQCVVTDREDSGRVVYVTRHGHPLAVRNQDIRKEGK